MPLSCSTALDRRFTFIYGPIKEGPAQEKLFGTEITKLSLYTFSKLMKKVTEEEIDHDMEVQKRIFSIKEEDLQAARGLSRVYLALKKYVTENDIQSYAPDCWPELRDIDQTPICPTNGRMNAEGVMASCEPVIEKVFGGLSQTAALKDRTATVCRLNSIRGRFSLHTGVGEVVETEPLLKGSNLSIRMRGGNMSFVESLLEHGIPHHNGLVYGNIIPELREFAHLMNVPIVVQE